MTSFSIRFDRGTGEFDVTELLGEHAREEALAVRVDAEIPRTNGDPPVPC
jgi:hypothetical protein